MVDSKENYKFDLGVKGLSTKSDQHPISPSSNAAESFIKIMRLKKMITKLRSFHCLRNSPCHYQRKYIEKSMENFDTESTSIYLQ